jgi:hypothetical protein
MIARSVASTLIGAFTFFLQVSFIASLPDPLLWTPIVLVTGAAVTQHLGVRDGASWIAASGMVFDAFGLTPFGLGTVSGLVAAGWLLFASQHIFSNRSLYGIVLCVLSTVIAWNIASSFILGMISLWGTQIDWAAQLRAAFWMCVLAIPCAGVLFKITPRVRPLLDRSHTLTHHP